MTNINNHAIIKNRKLLMITIILTVVGATSLVLLLVLINRKSTGSVSCPPDQVYVYKQQVNESDKSNGYCAYKSDQYDILKPVIMLYSDKDIDFTIIPKFTIDQGMIYPSYNYLNKGWAGKLVVGKNNTLLIDNKSYDYLFWEGNTNTTYDITKGNVVKREELVSFLERALDSFGLNAREKEDFITFWVPKMQKNPYSLVSFMNHEYADSHPMDIAPTPDYVNRVFMVFKKADKTTQITPQSFENVKYDKPERLGFSVVEWGGQELKD